MIFAGQTDLEITVDMLGYKTFHMFEMFKDLDRLHAGWTNVYQSQNHGRREL
jgi:hypothetical protein